MGLLKVAFGAVGSTLGDQWKEYFYCDALSNDTLVVKGSKKVSKGRNGNVKGMDNIISNGSVVAVNEGLRQVEEMSQNEMGKLTGGLNIPGLM